jgi:hypothetical protein
MSSNPTSDVGNVDRQTRAARLARDLEETSAVASTTVTPRDNVRINWQTRSSSLPPNVARVLAEHRATLRGVCFDDGTPLELQSTAVASPPRDGC